MSCRTLLLIIFTILAVTSALMAVSSAQDERYPGQASSVDQYLSWSNGDYDQPTYDTRFAKDPRSSRKLWGQESEDESGSLETAATRGESNNTTAEQSPDAAVEIAPAEQAASGTGANPQAAGSWSVTLSDGTSSDPEACTVDLILFQSGDLVFGHGTARTIDRTELVSAVGSIATGSMSLDLISSEPAEIYRLTLDTGKSPATGSYTAYSSQGDSWSGDASAEASG